MDARGRVVGVLVAGCQYLAGVEVGDHPALRGTVRDGGADPTCCTSGDRLWPPALLRTPMKIGISATATAAVAATEEPDEPSPWRASLIVLNRGHVEPGRDFGSSGDPAVVDRLLHGDRPSTCSMTSMRSSLLMPTSTTARWAVSTASIRRSRRGWPRCCRTSGLCAHARQLRCPNRRRHRVVPHHLLQPHGAARAGTAGVVLRALVRGRGSSGPPRGGG